MNKTQLEILEEILENNPPEKRETIAVELSTRTGLTKKEAVEAVENYYQVRSNGDGAEESVTETNQPVGEPTGEYLVGTRIVHEDDYDGTPPGLAVLEDVGHPYVPDLSHSYIPRPMKESDRMDVEVVTRMLADPDYSVLLVGETGVGKNVLLKHLFSETNRPARRVPFGLGTTYEALVGSYAPTTKREEFTDIISQARTVADEHDSLTTEMALQLLIGRENQFDFVNGLIKECAENGYAFVADELPAVPPEVTLALNGLTEEKDSRELTVLEVGQVITPHPQFLFCATTNPPDYAGLHRLNRAFKTRFYPVYIPYLDQEAEHSLLMEKTRLGLHDDGEAISVSLIKMARRFRSMSSSTLLTAVSSRELQKIANLIVDPDGSTFMRPEEAARTILRGAAENEEDWKTISASLDRHFKTE